MFVAELLYALTLPSLYTNRGCLLLRQGTYANYYGCEVCDKILPRTLVNSYNNYLSTFAYAGWEWVMLRDRLGHSMSVRTDQLILMT